MTLSHLPDPADLPPRFVLLDRILDLEKEEIRAARRFSGPGHCLRNCDFPARKSADFAYVAVGCVPPPIPSGPAAGKCTSGPAGAAVAADSEGDAFVELAAANVRRAAAAGKDAAGEQKSEIINWFSAPLWQGLEALAQLAALHQRWRRKFGQQVFLLSVQRLTVGTTAASSAFPVAAQASPAAAARVFSEAGNAPQRLPLDAPCPDGDCLLDARLLVSTEGAAQYDTSLRSPSGQLLMNVLLHIGVRPFPDSARAAAARRRYLELFPCLRNFPVPL